MKLLFFEAGPPNTFSIVKRILTYIEAIYRGQLFKMTQYHEWFPYDPHVHVPSLGFVISASVGYLRSHSTAQQANLHSNTEKCSRAEVEMRINFSNSSAWDIIRSALTGKIG